MSSWKHRLAITHVAWLPKLACGCCLFDTHGHITMIVWEAATVPDCFRGSNSPAGVFDGCVCCLMCTNLYMHKLEFVS